MAPIEKPGRKSQLLLTPNISNLGQGVLLT